jgi:hypothetical protein
MDPISHLQQLIGVLRRQVGDQLEKGSRRSPTGAHKTTKPSTSSNSTSLNHIRDTLIERAKAIKPDDARRTQRLNRLFLEAVLSSEFGEQILTDTAFSMLVDDIQAAMEANPHIRDQLTQLSVYLSIKE